MQLLLMPNLSKEGVHTCVNRLTAMRFGEPVAFLMDERLKGEFPGCEGVEWGPFESLIARCDACVAIGGDGTIIHSGKSAACRHKPVLGINLGRLGFLATLESDQLEKLEGLLTGDLPLFPPHPLRRLRRPHRLPCPRQHREGHLPDDRRGGDRPGRARGDGPV